MARLTPPQVFTDLTDKRELQVLNDFLRELARQAAVSEGGDLRGALIKGAAPATPVANVLYTDSMVKGWVRFQLTGTIDDDLNVSSVTDNAAGDWTINWAIPFATANYAVVGTARVIAGGVAQFATFVQGADTAPAVGSVRVFVVDGTTDTRGDPDSGVYVVAIGDQ